MILQNYLFEEGKRIFLEKIFFIKIWRNKFRLLHYCRGLNRYLVKVNRADRNFCRGWLVYREPLCKITNSSIYFDQSNIITS